jgi:hypothetical protein
MVLNLGYYLLCFRFHAMKTLEVAAAEEHGEVAAAEEHGDHDDKECELSSQQKWRLRRQRDIIRI